MLLAGGRRGSATARWWQATRLGLDAKYHLKFLGKLIIEAIGMRYHVKRALWHRRM